MTDERHLEKQVANWHEGHSDMPLHEYLGMTWYEYADWVLKDYVKADHPLPRALDRLKREGKISER